MKSGELLRMLLRAGWYIERQAGSHAIMRHKNSTEQLTVPVHGSAEVGKGLANKILKQAGLK